MKPKHHTARPLSLVMAISAAFLVALGAADSRPPMIVVDVTAELSDIAAAFRSDQLQGKSVAGAIAKQVHQWIEAKANTPLYNWMRQPILKETPQDHYVKEYPYFRFLPVFAGSAIPNGFPAAFPNDCFRDTSAVAKLSHNATTGQASGVSVTFTVSNRSDLLCADHYALITVESLHIVTINKEGTHDVQWDFGAKLTAAELFDVSTNGVRIGKIMISPANVLYALNSTVELFVPALTEANVSPRAAEVNVDFLRKYAGINMPPLTAPLRVPNASEIHSGDLFGGIRLDGLDPMLAWAMGASTGHMTAAIWEDGQLYVTESTTKDSYWPTDGIQKTPYDQWVQQVLRADYHFVWMPLKPEYQQKYDVQKALQTLHTFLGMPYGYHNMLWAWIDTEVSNYPCVPPNWDLCLDWQLVMPAFGFVDKIVPAISDKLWLQAFNKRLGTVNMTTAQVYMQLAAKGLSFTDLTMIPEQDNWMYTDGYSRMCDAWACTLLKSAGVFGEMGDQFQCTESTNWDVSALDLYSFKQQITGAYTMDIKGFDTKSWAPYPHYAEGCASRAPYYNKTRDC